MRLLLVRPCRHAGSTLVETMLCVGMLAVAIPMVFGALAESGKSGLAAKVETCGASIVRVCVDEIHASRDGRSRYFPSTRSGEAFPPPGDVWVLAFRPDGEAICKLTSSQYDSGVVEIEGEKPAWLAAVRAVDSGSQPGTPPMLRVDITIECPASRKASDRRKLDFHTLMP